MARRSEIHCPNGCPHGLFEVLNPTLLVHRDGSYASHDAHRSSYLCVNCRSVAVDLAAAAREMVEDDTADAATLTCPHCAAVMLPPEDDPLASRVECPACEERFFIEEGLPHLHGGGGQTESL